MALWEILQQAIEDQTRIGWEKLLLVGTGTKLSKTLQDFIDSENPNPPQCTASDWMNMASHQMLKFSLWRWMARNQTIYGATHQEQKQIALQYAREQITQIY